MSVQNVRLEEKANLLWVSGALGGAVTKEFLRSDLHARSARALMQGFTFLKGEQHVDQSTYQHHREPETYSDLLFRNVLRQHARSIFYGMIRVETGAQGTEGFQTNNNLLLDNGRANAIPGLEIIANAVQCSHGATVSRINPEQLFYLMSRGISRPDAERLIVQGFLRPIVDQLPLAHLREQVEEEIAERWNSAVRP